MHLLLTDETNVQPKEDVLFFVYGGLIVPLAALSELDTRITAARAKAGLKPDDEFKFETNSRPKHVEFAAWTQAKAETLKACVETGCVFIAYVVLHEIAKAQDLRTNIEWGANSVLGAFNKYLSQNKSFGVVALDRLASKDEYKLLSDRFTKGLVLAGGRPPVPLENIKLYASTCINASHASSAMDIVLGAFRYCINDPKNKEAGKEMMAIITKLIWCEKVGENIYAHDRGLLMRPKKVEAPHHRAKYDELLNKINILLK